MAVFGKYKRETSGSITCEKPIIMGSSKDEIIDKVNKNLFQLKI